MQILLLTPAYPPFPGGGERYVGALARELVRRGHTVTAVSTLAQTEQNLWQGTTITPTTAHTTDGVRLHRLPIRPFPFKRNGLLAWRKAMVLLSMLPGQQTAVLHKMARLIPPIQHLETTLANLPDQYDIVHAFNLSWEYPMMAGWQYARDNGIPFVVTPFAHFGTGNDRVAYNSTMDHQLAAMADADRLLVLTSIEQDGLVRLGMNADRIGVIGGGLDALPPMGERDELLGRFGIKRPFLIFVGRGSYDKGAIHAAEAAITLRQQGVDVQLVHVGQMNTEFDQFICKQASNEAIRPLGILNETDKHGLLAAATALLLPSRTDSFGIVFLEAWAHGTPVIGAQAGGIPGVVDDGVNGLLVPFGDVEELAAAAHRLLTDVDLATRFGQAGKEKVTTQYNWMEVGARVTAHYDAIKVQ